MGVLILYIEWEYYNNLHRDRSLIMGRGGATKWEGGHVKFYSYEKGDGKSFSHGEGGGGQHKFWGNLYTVA